MAAIIDYRGKTPRKTTTGVPLITAKIVKGGRIESPNEFVDPDEYEDWMRRGLPQVGDVVLTTEAPLGEVAQLQEARVALAQRLILLRGNPSVLDNTYLKFLMMSADVQSQLQSRASGTTVLGIKQSELRKVVFSLPPIKEQQAIAGILGALDDKIEQNRKTAQSLERLARATFRAWFVDFEPVKAKAAGATAFPSMPQPVFDALPTGFVDSDIGPVPEGWEVKVIGDVVTAKGGGTPSTKDAEYWDGGKHRWATPKDMSRLAHPLLLNTERRITDAGVNSISAGILPVGTVLMSSRAPVGYLAIAGVPTAINQGFIAMVCDGPLPPTYVLNWAFASMDAIKARASGTTFPEISKKSFRAMPAVVPTFDVVAAYRQVADPLFDLLSAYVKESEQLATMRDYLLPKLLSGQVSAESLLPEPE